MTNELYEAIAKCGILDAAKRGLLSGEVSKSGAITAGLRFKGNMELYDGVITDGVQSIHTDASVAVSPVAIPSGKTSWKVEVPEPLRSSVIRDMKWYAGEYVTISGMWREDGQAVQLNADVYTDAIWIELNNTSPTPVTEAASLDYMATTITRF